jgi:hypothetical protein
MAWIEAFAPVMAQYRAEVAIATWGHLAPRKRKSYHGHFLFAIPAYDSGTPCIVEAEFKGLDDSPWLYDAMWDFAAQTDKQGIYRFDGTFCNYEFNGTITPITTCVDATIAAREGME